jgi:hypothetical protein
VLKTTHRSAGALAARRARAQAEKERADAELREIAAQRAAELAAAEAEGARRQAEQEAGRAHMAERAAQLDGLVAEVRQSVEQQEKRERERQEQLKKEVQEMLDWKPPTPRMSPEEIAALRRQLDWEIAEDDRRYAMEQERLQREELDRAWRRRRDRTLTALRDLKRQQEQES